MRAVLMTNLDPRRNSRFALLALCAVATLASNASAQEFRDLLPLGTSVRYNNDIVFITSKEDAVLTVTLVGKDYLTLSSDEVEIYLPYNKIKAIFREKKPKIGANTESSLTPDSLAAKAREHKKQEEKRSLIAQLAKQEAVFQSLSKEAEKLGDASARSLASIKVLEKALAEDGKIVAFGVEYNRDQIVADLAARRTRHKKVKAEIEAIETEMETTHNRILSISSALKRTKTDSANSAAPKNKAEPQKPRVIHGKF